MLTHGIALVYAIALTSSYQDETPDPYLSGSHSAASSSYQDKCDCHGQHELCGYFRFIIKETLKSKLLSDDDRRILENLEQSDPQSSADVIVRMIREYEMSTVKSSLVPLDLGGVVNTITDFLIVLRDSIHPKIIVVVTVFYFMWCQLYKIIYNQEHRTYHISFTVFLLYVTAVAGRISVKYNEHRSRQMSAVHRDIPATCTGDFAFSQLLRWNRVGDECQQYYRDIHLDPLSEIDLFQCLAYPLVSLLLTPVTVLGDVLSTTLPKMLQPFPMYLQVIIVAMVILGPALYVYLCRFTPNTLHMEKEVREIGIVHETQMRELRSEIDRLRTAMITEFRESALTARALAIEPECRDLAAARRDETEAQITLGNGRDADL